MQITRIDDHLRTRKIWAAIIATAAPVLLPANRSAIFNSDDYKVTIDAMRKELADAKI